MKALNDNHERAGIYRLLASVFLEPPKAETFESIKMDFDIKITDTPEAASLDFGKIMDELPPMESLYGYQTGGRSLDVFSFYSSAGLVLWEEFDLPPDHLGVEMLFMSYLIENNYFELQKKFLEFHLLRWAPQYLDRVSGAASTRFYKEMSGIAKDFIVSDYEGIFD